MQTPVSSGAVSDDVLEARPPDVSPGLAAEIARTVFGLEDEGYTATRHQREVGAGYFDQVLETITGGTSSTLALKGSTEEGQFAAA